MRYISISTTLFLVACSATAPTAPTSTSPSNGTSRGSASATSGSTGSSPAASNGGDGTGTFCSAMSSYIQQCSKSADCYAAFEKECPESIAPLQSDAIARALNECMATNQVSCGSVGAGENDCIRMKLEAVPPTAAQDQLAADFCAACAQGAVATHQQGVSCAGHVVEGSGRTLATELLSLSDAATAKAESCIRPASAQYPADYDNCENAFLDCVDNLGPGAPAACSQ
jgi:hypothetical protein